jgi:hypothetical protein
MIRRTIATACVAVMLFGCSQSPPAPTAAGRSSPPAPSPDSPSADETSTTTDKPGAGPGTDAPSQTADSTATAPKTSANGDAKPSGGNEPKKPASADDLIAQARQAGQGGDFATAVNRLDEVLAKDAANVQALALMTLMAQEQGQVILRTGDDKACLPFFLKSAQAFRKLRDANPELPPAVKQTAPVVLYNEACCHAIDGKPEQAVASLGDAIDAGFNDAAQFDKDKDLDSLREREDYKKVRARLGN